MKIVTIKKKDTVISPDNKVCAANVIDEQKLCSINDGIKYTAIREIMRIGFAQRVILP